jgi:hypothetical protein
VGDPAREWDGQRFLRHVASKAMLRSMCGYELRDLGVTAATSGRASAEVIRAEGEIALSDPREVAIVVVLAGSATVAGRTLRDGDAATLAGRTQLDAHGELLFVAV